jgi:WD40 repeat protein
VRIWDPLTGKELQVLHQPDRTTGVAFSPDGMYLLTGSFDGIARLWDVSGGQELRRFAGHSGTLNGVAFSPDGRYVLTTGDDRTARLWDAQTGQEVRRFVGHGDLVRMGAVSPDGKYVLTVSNDETARLWYADYHDTIDYVCSLLTRDLSADERIRYGLMDQQPTCPAR